MIEIESHDKPLKYQVPVQNNESNNIEVKRAKVSITM